MTKKIKANLYEISRFQCQENYRETAPYLEQPGHHCLHLLKNNTSCTRNLFPWLGESTDENKALLFFTGWEAEFKVLAIPYNPLGHCVQKNFLTAIWFAMLQNSVNQTFAHTDFYRAPYGTILIVIQFILVLINIFVPLHNIFMPEKQYLYHSIIYVCLIKHIRSIA